jgi:hypothetical protein
MADIYSSSAKKKTSPVSSTKKNSSFKKTTEKPRSPLLKEVRKEVYDLVGKTRNPFSSFVARPANVNFENQAQKEKIILLLRRHWVTNIRWLFFTTLMILAPILLNSVPLLSFLPGRFQMIAVLMWYMFTTAYVLESFLGWYFNVYIITDERIVDIDFISLIYKEVSDADIEMIQDVTYKQGGIVRTMFNFGTILVQTAAEKPNFEFADVPNPALVVKLLQKMRMEERQEQLEGRIR